MQFPTVNLQGTKLQITNLHFKGTQYTTYNCQEATIVIKIYDPGFDRFMSTERRAISLLPAHPNLARTQEAEMGGVKVLAIEKCQLLQQFLKEQSKGLAESEIVKILLHLCRAASAAHSRGVIHRDIRPENILIGTDGNIKLWNFQRSAFQIYTPQDNYQAQIKAEIQNNTFQHVRAPEQNDFQAIIGEKVDIYAIGQVIYYMIYNALYDQMKPVFHLTNWGVYSEKIQALLKYLLSRDPNQRPSADQVEEYLVTAFAKPHVRSISSNERAQKEMEVRNSMDKFNVLEFAEIPQQQESSILTKIIKMKSKYSNKTEGWVYACLEEISEAPKQKYLRYLVVKSWNKKDKIVKFYAAVHKHLSRLSSIVVTFKILLLIHNYVKKGPSQVLIDHKEFAALPLLVAIKEQHQQFAMKQSKDKLRTQFTNNLLSNYAYLLIEKVKLHIYYKDYMEGNYSLTPFFNNMSKSPLKMPMVTNLLKFWEKLITFSEQILGEQTTLIRLQLYLCLIMMDELYSICCVSTHLFYAIKWSTNYVDGIDVNQMKQQITLMQDMFTKNYNDTIAYYSGAETVQQLRQAVPTLPKQIIDTIKAVPVLQPLKGDFNIFDYLSYAKDINGLRIPVSYGEVISNNKIENDEHEVIDLNMENEKYATQNYASEPVQVHVQEIDFKKQQSSLQPQLQRKSIPAMDLKRRQTNNGYEDLSISDDESSPHTDQIQPSIRKLESQLQSDDFLAMPVSPNKRIQSARISSDFMNAPFPNQTAPRNEFFNQFAPPQFEIGKFIDTVLKKSNIYLQLDSADWVIAFEQLTLDKQIGTGSSCEVFRGFWNQKEVAIKRMKIKSLSENHMKEFRREIQALVTIKPHPNLVRLMGISQEKDDLYIVTEFCAGGTLFDLLHRKKHLDIPWSSRLRMCQQVAQGMAYLHELNPPLIHRDLKSLNLLLETQFDPQQPLKVNIKIADFGLARIQLDNGEAMTGVLGTFHWMAPEIFESIPYSTKADVFSFGIVMWEICCRETPYKQFTQPIAIMKFVTLDKGRPDLALIQPGCPNTLKETMIRCWDHDPSRRPRFTELNLRM